MNGKGYVQISRGALDADIWEDPYNAALYFYCLLNASYNYYKGLEPGQFYSSVLSLSKKLGWGRNCVSRHLARLVLRGLVQRQPASKGLKITVTRWQEICQGISATEADALEECIPGAAAPNRCTNAQADAPKECMPDAAAPNRCTNTQTDAPKECIPDAAAPNWCTSTQADAPNWCTEAPEKAVHAPIWCNACTPKEHTQEYNTKNNNNSINIPKEREREFEAWWRQYPRHEGRSEARKLWMELRRTWSARTLAAALERAKQSSGWLQNRQYIPSAARWLDGGWEDYLDPEDQGGASEWKEY